MLYTIFPNKYPFLIFENLPMRFKITLFCLIVLASLISATTNLSVPLHSRITCDFSIKEKRADGKTQLTMGKVFYDQKIKQIVYQIKFPEKEIRIVTEKYFYVIINGKLEKKEKNEVLPERSIFHLSLTNTMENYGLKSSAYKYQSTTDEEDGTHVSTWLPAKKNDNLYGKIMVSQKGTFIDGIILYNSKQELTKKCFYKDYIDVNHVFFPKSLIEISYLNNKEEDYQLTTYSNVKVDDEQENEMYGYRLPEK